MDADPDCILRGQSDLVKAGNSYFTCARCLGLKNGGLPEEKGQGKRQKAKPEASQRLLVLSTDQATKLLSSSGEKSMRLCIPQTST